MKGRVHVRLYFDNGARYLSHFPRRVPTERGAQRILSRLKGVLYRNNPRLHRLEVVTP